MGGGECDIIVVVLLASLLLAATVSAAGGDTERAIIDGVNQERRGRGMQALTPDEALSEVARRYSCAMAQGGFVAHTAPDGDTLSDRLQRAGSAYRAAGENLAYIEGPAPAPKAVAGWMKSPPHRENILRRDFTTTGVGACRSDRGTYFTQLFVRPR